MNSAARRRVDVWRTRGEIGSGWVVLEVAEQVSLDEARYLWTMRSAPTCSMTKCNDTIKRKSTMSGEKAGHVTSSLARCGSAGTVMMGSTT